MASLDLPTTLKVRAITWDVLRTFARNARDADPGECQFFSSTGGGTCLIIHVGKLLKEEGLVKDVRVFETGQRGAEDRKVHKVVREVFFDALAFGFIMPGKVGQELNWGAGRGAFEFTGQGLQVLSADGPIMTDAGSLKAVLHEKKAAGLGIEESTIELLAEAHKCWASHCCRAAVVLIGLASEQGCLDLVRAVADYPSPPAPGSKNHPDCVQLTN